jgi:hypothetical protein
MPSPSPDPFSCLGDTGTLLRKRKLCPKKLCHLRGSPHNLGTTWEQLGPNRDQNSANGADVKARQTNKIAIHDESAKPLFGGSIPARASKNESWSWRVRVPPLPPKVRRFCYSTTLYSGQLIPKNPPDPNWQAWVFTSIQGLSCH